jgi:hypothetical protein
MPVRRRGRFVTSTPEELNVWLGREAGKLVHVATEESLKTFQARQRMMNLFVESCSKTYLDQVTETDCQRHHQGA